MAGAITYPEPPLVLSKWEAVCGSPPPLPGAEALHGMPSLTPHLGSSALDQGHMHRTLTGVMGDGRPPEQGLMALLHHGSVLSHLPPLPPRVPGAS